METEPSGQTEQFQKLEQEAFQLAAEGKFGKAVENLDIAMKLKHLWYHDFYKAVWLYNANKQQEAATLIDNAVINYSVAEQFYFLCLRNEFRFKLAVGTATNSLSGTDNAVKLLDSAIPEMERTQYILFSNKVQVDNLRRDIPENLRRMYPTFLNLDDLSGHVLTLRYRIEMIRQSLILFKAMFEAENRATASIEATRSRIESERVRIIELLGIFTAIFAFIFAGVQILTRVSLVEGLILQSGMALIMIIFFLGFHIVIDPEARTKLLIGTLAVLLLGLLFGLPLYAKFLRGAPVTLPNTVNSEQQVRIDPNIIQKVNKEQNTFRTLHNDAIIPNIIPEVNKK